MATAMVFDAANAILEPWPLGRAVVLEGEPTAAGHVLYNSDDDQYQQGIWELTPGVITDTEFEQNFVVLRGRGSIEIEGSEALAITPGVTGRIPAGTKVTWRVEETVRKVYTVWR